jgi:hypothetical protein
MCLSTITGNWTEPYVPTQIRRFLRQLRSVPRIPDGRIFCNGRSSRQLQRFAHFRTRARIAFIYGKAVFAYWPWNHFGSIYRSVQSRRAKVTLQRIWRNDHFGRFQLTEYTQHARRSSRLRTGAYSRAEPRARARDAAAKSFSIPASRAIRKFSPIPVTPGQIVCLTYPQIGNVGANAGRRGIGSRPFIESLIVREFSAVGVELALHRNRAGLSFERHNIPVIWGSGHARVWCGTFAQRRRHARHRLDRRYSRGKTCGRSARASRQMVRTRARVSRVTCDGDAYQLGEGLDRADRSLRGTIPRRRGRDRTVQETPSAFALIAYDFGIKQNILRLLVDGIIAKSLWCRRKLQPKTFWRCKPDGVFLSNGPGDPEPDRLTLSIPFAVLLGRTPVFGICLGHQLCGLALGGKDL